MRKNKLLLCGSILLILAIVCYMLLHNISDIYIFSFFNNISFFSKLNGINIFIFKKFITGYLVDLLWFISAWMFFTVLLSSEIIIKNLLLLVLAVISEGLQYFFQRLGTFDVYDLLLYLIILLVFLILEIRKII